MAAETDENGKSLNYYVLVDTYTQAMAIQDALREGNVPSRVSPVPYAIQHIAGCGVAILLEPINVESAREVIDGKGLPYHSIEPLACQINPRRDKFV